METEAFVETVSDRTDSDSDAATDATRAVLTTLGEQLSEDPAHDLASQIPGEFSDHLTEGESGQRFSEEEFVSRVDQFEHYGFEELLSETNTEVDGTDRTPRER